MPSELYINKEQYKQENASSQVMNSLFSFMVSMGINIGLENLQKQAFTTQQPKSFFSKHFGTLKNMTYLNKQQPNDVFKQLGDIYNNKVVLNDGRIVNEFTWPEKQNLFSVFGDNDWNDGVKSMKGYNKLFKQKLKDKSLAEVDKKVINSVKRGLFAYKVYGFFNFVSSAKSAEAAIDLGYNLVKGIVLDPLQERGRRVEEKENQYAYRMSKYKDSSQYVYQDSEQNQMYRSYQQQKIQEYYQQAVGQTAIDRIENPYIIYRMM